MSVPQWNAHVHIEGATAKWIGLGWGVADDGGDPKCYKAKITVAAPADANAMIGKVGVNEKVELISRTEGLACGPDGIEIEVTYFVERNVDYSDKGNCSWEAECFQYNIAENAGQKATPTGDVLPDGGGEGDIGQPITIRTKVPGSCL